MCQLRYHYMRKFNLHICKHNCVCIVCIGCCFSGRAGRDYPILSYIPKTTFACELVADYPGYYADMEAGCQVKQCIKLKTFGTCFFMIIISYSFK